MESGDSTDDGDSGPAPGASEAAAMVVGDIAGLLDQEEDEDEEEEQTPTSQERDAVLVARLLGRDALPPSFGGTMVGAIPCWMRVSCALEPVR